MLNIADLIVIAIVGLMGFIGYKRGFVKTAFGMLSFIIAIILAVSFYKSLATVLAEKTGIDEWIYETVSGKMSSDTKQINDNQNNEEEDSIKNTLNNLPEKIKNELGLEDAKMQAKSMVAEKIVTIALNLISFVGIYVISRIILAIVCFVLDLVMKLPVLKQANEILGLIFGIIQGVLSICAALAIIMSLSSIINLQWILGYVKGSLIADFLYENNFIMWLLF